MSPRLSKQVKPRGLHPGVASNLVAFQQRNRELSKRGERLCRT